MLGEAASGCSTRARAVAGDGRCRGRGDAAAGPVDRTVVVPGPVGERLLATGQVGDTRRAGGQPYPLPDSVPPAQLNTDASGTSGCRCRPVAAGRFTVVPFVAHREAGGGTGECGRRALPEGPPPRPNAAVAETLRTGSRRENHGRTCGPLIVPVCVPAPVSWKRPAVDPGSCRCLSTVIAAPPSDWVASDRYGLDPDA